MVKKNSYKLLKYWKGAKAAAIIRRIADGWTTNRIANRFNVKNSTVAAFRANFTRDAYYPYAYPKTPYQGR